MYLKQPYSLCVLHTDKTGCEFEVDEWKEEEHMQNNNKLREWMFILFLVSIPVAF